MSLTQLVANQVADLTAIREHAARLQARWPEAIRLDLDDAASIYDAHPYLFLPAFSPIPAEAVRELALAGRLFASTVFLADAAIDAVRPGPPTSKDVLRTVALQHEAYRLLHGRFDHGSPFWDQLQRLLSDWARACALEIVHRPGAGRKSEFTQSLASRIAIDKAGLSKATVFGLAALAGGGPVLQLAQSIDGYNAGHQLLDDLLDWKADLERGQPTFLLTRLVSDAEWQSGQLPAGRPQEVARELYYGGHAAAVLSLAVEHLANAQRLLDDLPTILWRTAIAGLQRRAQDLLGDVERMVSHNRRRLAEQPLIQLARPKIPDRPWTSLGWTALDLVLHEWGRGFGELRHIMAFPQSEGFTGKTELQFGDTFQRALIADVLCDARPLLGDAASTILDYEVDHVLNARSRVGVGGWIYFPELPELPPDADDLAQIMQVLLRTGRHGEVLEYCEPPLAVLLRNGRHPDGSFDTWIIPATGRTAAQERHVWFVGNAWSRSDPEVIANLLYALNLYDAGRFRALLDVGGRYLERAQEADGSWTSTWYHGPFYGVHVALRLLAAVRPASPAVAAALTFLRSRQKSDGGWGVAGRSDPLSTALALLGLAASPPRQRDQLDAERAERARRFLEAGHDQTAGWGRYPLIRMDLGNWTALYQSRTLVAAFIAKAALAWDYVNADSR
jgi:squalene-hopene/tetraprenyl-beta-curcumene cyclase